LNAHRLTIVTYNEEQTLLVNEKSIEIIPLWKWLCLF